MPSIGVNKETAVIITVSDAYGSQRIRKRIQVSSASAQTLIDVSKLPKGTYFINVFNGKEVSKTTFVKAE